MKKYLRTWQSSPVPYARVTIADGIILALAGVLLAAFMYPPQPADATLPDMDGLRAETRKETFFGYLKPIVSDVNALIAERRAHLFELAGAVERGEPLSHLDNRWLQTLAARYEVPIEGDDGRIDADALATLKRRVDIVPQSLVLSQAAKESGWGRSRFAVEANNLFGQRCYDAGCGLVPRLRSEGATFEVRSFDTVRDSVESYLRNLNTHPQHKEFRDLRASLRSEQRPLSGVVLADGLTQYSERRSDYVDEIQSLIVQNDLEDPQAGDAP